MTTPFSLCSIDLHFVFKFRGNSPMGSVWNTCVTCKFLSDYNMWLVRIVVKLLCWFQRTSVAVQEVTAYSRRETVQNISRLGLYIGMMQLHFWAGPRRILVVCILSEVAIHACLVFVEDAQDSNFSEIQCLTSTVHLWYLSWTIVEHKIQDDTVHNMCAVVILSVYYRKCCQSFIPHQNP